VRPTSSRVLDAIFNSLAASVPDALVLDLFAGTGRLGIEALRRGAQEAVFVERDARTAAMIKDHLAAAGVADRGTVTRSDALSAVAALAAAGRRFDVVLLDPPYGRGLQRETLQRVAVAPILAPAGIVIVEGHWRDDPGDVAGLIRIRSTRYGETAVWVYARDVKKEEAG
jgi:16S rRNA (guanine966-N2)-methyltransferase